MPLCKQPKTLVEICVKYSAANIDNILKYEERMELSYSNSRFLKFRGLPILLHRHLSDKIIELGGLHDDNYQKILGDKTRNLLFRKDSCKITKHAEFLEFLNNYCKNIVNIDLEPFLTSIRWTMNKQGISRLVGKVFSSMIHLEWINLKNCDVDDECMKCIGATCSKLKYLNVEECDDVTDDGFRALCDPEYGKCAQLTHLYLKKEDDRDIDWEELSVEVVSLALLHCPNLQVLDYERAALALAEAISTFDKSDGIKWYLGDEYESDDSDKISSLCDQTAAASIDPTSGQLKWFKLTSLVWNFVAENAEGFFRAVGKYCPLLEDLTLDPVILIGECELGLAGIYNLPLKSVTLGPRRTFSMNDIRPINVESLLLLRSVGHSLTTLNLKRQAVFDLRVIKKECPNLTSLELVYCATTRASATWPNYPVNELGNTAFDSLQCLTLTDSLISPENFVTLLSSPNLKVINFKEFPSGNVLPQVIQHTLFLFPDAFIRLQTLSLDFLEMDKLTLGMLFHRATNLNDLSIIGCFSHQGGGFSVLDDMEHVNVHQ